MMSEQRVSNITISLPRPLLDLADSLARERSTTRSGMIAELLKKEETAGIQWHMAQGYREVAEENLREAEEALNLTSAIIARDG